MFDEISYERAARANESTPGSWEELYSTADQPLTAVPAMERQANYRSPNYADTDTRAG